MTTNNFKTGITNLLELPLADVKAHFENHDNRKPLGEVTFFDLRVEDQSVSDGLRRMKYGVYLFFNADGKCAYVGETESSLANRFLQHFGFLEGDGRNQYLKHTLEREAPDGGRETKDYATQMLKMKDHSIAIVNVTSQWDKIEEKLKPHCNSNKWDDWESWSTKFVLGLEKTMQAIYCPPKSEPYFLNRQKNHTPLLNHQQKIRRLASGGADFAEILARTIPHFK